MNKLFTYCAFLIFFFALYSCFKKDEQVAPIKLPPSFKPVQIDEPYSIYQYNSYVDLDSGVIVKTVPLSSWDLSFESSAKGWHIRINSGYARRIARSGSTDFSTDFSTSPGSWHWLFDHPNGSPDSTAVGQWIDNSHKSLNEVYILGNDNGNGTFTTLAKFVFKSYNDTSYTFIYSQPNGIVADTITIIKDTTYRSVFFSLATPKQRLLIEPTKNQWDLMMGTYETYDFDNSVQQWVPYPVRGVLSNLPYVKVAKVKDANYWNFTLADTIGKPFSANQEAIGFDWKDYNSKDINPYRIVPNLYYVIHTKSGNYVKLLFVNYAIHSTVNGYPLFILSKIN